MLARTSARKGLPPADLPREANPAKFFAALRYIRGGSESRGWLVLLEDDEGGRPMFGVLTKYLR